MTMTTTTTTTTTTKGMITLNESLGWLWLSVVVSLVQSVGMTSSYGAEIPLALASEKIESVTQEQLATGPPGIRLGVWIGGTAGKPACTHEMNRPMPAASSIKTALLLELFAVYENRLGAASEEVGAIFADEMHPAFSHYTPRQRDEVREALSKASVEEIGAIMIGTAKAPNRVYNGAANLAIALLEGPKEATRRLHARDPQFAGLKLNRYMLADRNVTGDNMATPAALASVLGQLATGHVPGVSTETVQQARETLFRGGTDRKHFAKAGALQSDPLTYVLTGWYEERDSKLIYVVMGSVPRPNTIAEGDAAYAQLKQSVVAVQEVAITACLP